MRDLSESYCVIGDPIEHSLSPQIHNFVYACMELPLRYETVRVPPDSLASFVEECRKTRRPGFNVTISHKVIIIPYLDELDSLSDHTDAVNTVKNQNRKLIGFNTDVHGCRTALELGGWSPKGKVILLGAGGAARAAVEALISFGQRRIIIFDLDETRVKNVKEDFNNHPQLEIHIGSLERGDLENHLQEVDLLINATPVGLWPHVEQSLLPHPELIPRNATVFDMVPRPFITRLLSQAQSIGARTISGLSMLIAQALAAQQIWQNKKLPKELYERVWIYMIKIRE